ncbi:hypothetical protein ACFUPZ_05430 [Microbacterium oxydans]|uniref:hypothetical protein n=1 Tax=Microbacterium oxydans TaxID=82380 RepID=UPI003630A57C
MTIHPEGINPTGNTQLVDENTRIVLEFVAGRRSGMCTQTEIRDAARAVLDALAAQTRPHADDERRDLIDLIDIASDGTHPPAGVVIVTGKEAAYYADRILAAGFRRTEVPESSAEHECTWACWVDEPWLKAGTVRRRALGRAIAIHEIRSHDA